MEEHGEAPEGGVEWGGGVGMEWPIPLPIPAEVIMSLGFLCSMDMGARNVCRGVWEGGLDDMHGLTPFFPREIQRREVIQIDILWTNFRETNSMRGTDTGSFPLQLWSVQSTIL